MDKKREEFMIRLRETFRVEATEHLEAITCRSVVGFGAQVTVLDVSHHRLKYLDDIYRGQLQTRISDEATIEDVIAKPIS